MLRPEKFNEKLPWHLLRHFDVTWSTILMAESETARPLVLFCSSTHTISGRLQYSNMSWFVYNSLFWSINEQLPANENQSVHFLLEQITQLSMHATHACNHWGVEMTINRASLDAP